MTLDFSDGWIYAADAGWPLTLLFLLRILLFFLRTFFSCQHLWGLNFWCDLLDVAFSTYLMLFQSFFLCCLNEWWNKDCYRKVYVGDLAAILCVNIILWLVNISDLWLLNSIIYGILSIKWNMEIITDISISLWRGQFSIGTVSDDSRIPYQANNLTNVTRDDVADTSC